MSADHRRPVLAFVALALVAVVVVVVHRADARGGLVVAASTKPEVRVAGALGYPTQGEVREAYLWPAFGRLPGSQESGQTTGPGVVRRPAGTDPSEPATTPHAAGAAQQVASKGQPPSPRVSRGESVMPGRIRPPLDAQADAAGAGPRPDGSEAPTRSLAASAGPRTQALSAAPPDRRAAGRAAGRAAAASDRAAQGNHGHQCRAGHNSGRGNKAGRGHRTGTGHQAGRDHRAGRGHRADRGHRAGRGHGRHGKSRR